MTDKRAEIEAAATRAIQQGGLNSVSFRTLADEVGVKSSSVHYHFPTKPDLARAVISGYTDRFEARLAEIGRRRRTLNGKLEGLIDTFHEVFTRGDICLCGMMAAEATSLDPEARQVLERFFRITEAWLEDVFVSHAAELTVAVPARQLARVVLSGLEGALLVDRLEQRDERLSAWRAMTRAITS